MVDLSGIVSGHCQNIGGGLEDQIRDGQRISGQNAL